LQIKFWEKNIVSAPWWRLFSLFLVTVLSGLHSGDGKSVIFDEDAW